MRKVLAVAVALLTAGAMAQFKPDSKEQRDHRMKWWREARLGMFIHWGLYAITAGQYKGRTNYGEWIREEAQIPLAEYLPLKDQFNPVKFDAEQWVKMARDAGMKYITITTKHHDGFNLFNSPFSDWDVMSTPFKRDIMAEMAAACKKYGIKLCWYHSIMDWHHPDYLPRRTWEVGHRPATGANFRNFVTYLRNEVEFLLKNYGDIGVMWFDGEWESTWNAKDGSELYELCRLTQPNVIVNNRVTVGRGGIEDSTSLQAGDFTTPEQYIPPTGLPGLDWETCMTMNDHWGYNSKDSNWKSSKQLIQNIVDIASKGGNYLLNVGPRADGTFPPESMERLRDIGDWMKVNGDAIYGTTASVFENLPWGRSTTKKGPKHTTLYLHVFDWPSDGRLVVPGIGNKPISARMMSARNNMRLERVGPNLVLHVNSTPPDPICSVVRLDVEGAPIVYSPPRISSPSDILVESTVAEIHSGSPELVVRYTLDGADPSKTSAEAKGPIRIDKSLVLKAASFHKGEQVSTVSVMRFTKVTPKPAVQPTSTLKGIRMLRYKGDWSQLPDFSKLTPYDSYVANEVGLPGMKDLVEHWGARFSGWIEVPDDGVYVFALTSDDGSRLWIDGELVVDNDGLHSSVTKQGKVALAKGFHRIEAGWFNKTGGLELDLRWGRAGDKLKTATEFVH